MNAGRAKGRQMVIGGRSAEVNIDTDSICTIIDEHKEFSSSPPYMYGCMCIRSKSIIRSQGEFRASVGVYV
jgi:hypothetical protein